MNNQNWPQGVNRASSNWTGRTPRNMTGGAWKPDSDKIPLSGWIGGIATALLLVGLFIVGAEVF